MTFHSRVAFLLILLAALAVTGCSSDAKVGVVISESGSLSSYGDAVKKALDLAAEEINAAGGIHGGSVILIYKDDATNAERGKQVTEELIKQEGVNVIIGAISSTVTLAIAPLCEEKRVVLLSPAASTPKLTNAGMYIYRNYPSDILEGTAMAKFAKDLGLENIAVFAMDNDFGHGLESVFTDQFVGKSRFRKVVKAFHWNDGDTAAFKDMVAEAKELGADGVYIVSYVKDMAELLTEIENSGLRAVLMGSASVTGDLLELAGDAAANLVYPQSMFDVNSTEPEVASFVQAYRQRYNEDPDIYAAHAYDALKLVAKAIESGGSTHPDHIKTGLNAIEGYAGAAGRTEFDSEGDVVRYPRIYIIRNGEVEPYEKYVEEGGSLLIEN